MFADGRHVLVKYAGQGGDVAERWRDLLALENIALGVVRDAGSPAANAELIDSSTHRFLEVERFDRVGMRGRRAAMTLAAVHHRATDTWAEAARSMADAGTLSRDDATTLQRLDAFAQLIANTDRHQYNVVLFPEGRDGERMVVGARRYRLAPAFDQLPMLYAPTGDGQIPLRRFTRSTPSADTWSVWEEALELARDFWERATHDVRVSAGMREIARVNRTILDRS